MFKYQAVTDPDQLQLCNQLIASTGYYGPVDLAQLGGVTFAAVGTDGRPRATLWISGSGYVVLLDYLAADPGCRGAGIRLLAYVKNWLLKAGIKQVRYAIHATNPEAGKISAAFGGLNDYPYMIGCIQLEDSNGQ